MKTDAWLTEVRSLVASGLPEVETSSADETTATFALGRRGVVVHLTTDIALLAPSVSAGNSIASRLESKVEHLDVQSFAVNERSISAAADAIIGHLR
jgi:hypothetical protein